MNVLSRFGILCIRCTVRMLETRCWLNWKIGYCRALDLSISRPPIVESSKDAWFRRRPTRRTSEPQQHRAVASYPTNSVIHMEMRPGPDRLTPGYFVRPTAHLEGRVERRKDQTRTRWWTAHPAAIAGSRMIPCYGPAVIRTILRAVRLSRANRKIRTRWKESRTPERMTFGSSSHASVCGTTI